MSKVTLKNVRLSFPSLFQKATFNGTETKFEATFLLNKKEHADTIKQLQDEIALMIKNDLKGAKLGADKICLRDGDDTSYDGYAGCYSTQATVVAQDLMVRLVTLATVATAAAQDLMVRPVTLATVAIVVEQDLTVRPAILAIAATADLVSADIADQALVDTADIVVLVALQQHLQLQTLPQPQDKLLLQ